MRCRRGLTALIALVCAGALGAVAGAPAAVGRAHGAAAAVGRAHGAARRARAPATFAGSCHFAGPIKLGRPITVVPVPGAHFSYAGAGTCTGALDGTKVAAAPLTVTFTDAMTLFDTCELGPDVGLHGVAAIGRDRFPIAVELARVLLAGPFLLSTPHGGRAAGIAQFQPADVQASIVQCGTTGVPAASLSGDFTTLRALSGRR
jgi:hypothetical protein